MTLTKIIMTGGIALLGLSGCVMDPVPYDRPQAQSDEEIIFVKSVLNDLQVKSFDAGLEYCGYLILDAAGDFGITEPRTGREGTCRPKPPKGEEEEIASFHTHGAYSADYDSEYPSLDDIRADALEGNDGYVATPGGRLWYISGLNSTATLLCGEGCITADAGYRPNDNHPEVGRGYSIADLDEIFNP